MFKHFRKYIKRKILYKNTINELNSLSSRELSDIGINRGDIPFIAKQLAHRNV